MLFVDVWLSSVCDLALILAKRPIVSVQFAATFFLYPDRDIDSGRAIVFAPIATASVNLPPILLELP